MGVMVGSMVSSTDGVGVSVDVEVAVGVGVSTVNTGTGVGVSVGKAAVGVALGVGVDVGVDVGMDVGEAVAVTRGASTGMVGISGIVGTSVGGAGTIAVGWSSEPKSVGKAGKVAVAARVGVGERAG